MLATHPLIIVLSRRSFVESCCMTDPTTDAALAGESRRPPVPARCTAQCCRNSIRWALWSSKRPCWWQGLPTCSIWRSRFGPANLFALRKGQLPRIAGGSFGSRFLALVQCTSTRLPAACGRSPPSRDRHCRDCRAQLRRLGVPRRVGLPDRPPTCSSCASRARSWQAYHSSLDRSNCCCAIKVSTHGRPLSLPVHVYYTIVPVLRCPLDGPRE